jgi:hypothetical protein
MTENQRRLGTLDAKNFEPFAVSYGPSLDSELDEWITVACSEDETQKKFERLNTIAWYVFVERQGTVFGEPVRFPVTSRLAGFQEFVYSFNVFATMKIPTGEWSDVADRMIQVLVEEATLGTGRFDSSGCLEAREFAGNRLKEIAENPKYGQRYTDLLNGAL